MKFRWLFPFLFVLSQCASPPHAPPPGQGDDGRFVSRAEFAASRWTALPGAVSWQAVGSGAVLTLADGREASLTFPAPGVMRWWVAPAAGARPLSPGAKYPERGVAASVSEAAGVLLLDTPALGVRLKLADLSWTLTRGDTVVLSTAGGPRAAGRRLTQGFAAAGTTWFGPGLEAGMSANFWVSNHPDTVGPWAVPFVFGLGAVPVAIALDNSYQTYSRVTSAEVSLGSLNGGLDLLLAASPQPDAAVEALTQVTGRPPAVPGWASVTALALPAAETGAFVRQAKLAVGTAFGPAADRTPTQFRQIVAGPATTESASWTVPGAGSSLAAYGGSDQWTKSWGPGAPLARMNNLVPSLAAQAAAEARTAPAPVLTRSAGPGTVRWAIPELAVPGDSLARAFTLGLAGWGTPAVRLDLSGLSADETREATFRSLLAWLMDPVLTLDWGPEPAALWTSLTDADKKRLKTILDVRSQFQPVLAQAARKTAATGKPAWSPVWFAAPHDPQALTSDEMLLGDLLVAPVTGDAARRKVYLPGPGVWFDFWTGEEFGGGRSYDVAFKTDRPLLYVRGGGFVPTREPETYDGRGLFHPLTMHVFPGGRGEGSYYFDDGTSAGKPGTFVETRLVFDYSQREMTLEHQAVASASGLRSEPYMLYRLHNVYRPRQVAIDGKAVPLFGPSWGITESDRSAAWYEDDRTLLVKTFRPDRNQLIEMSF